MSHLFTVKTKGYCISGFLIHKCIFKNLCWSLHGRTEEQYLEMHSYLVCDFRFNIMVTNSWYTSVMMAHC